MMTHICYNGNFLIAGIPVHKPDDRSYRYGDGIFETIKVFNTKILLKDYHFKRMADAFSLLHYRLPPNTSLETFEKNILELCKINGCCSAARVRLSFSNGNGNLGADGDTVNYLIEAWPLDISLNLFNEKGLFVNVFPYAQKNCDIFSSLKTASSLLYSVAAQYAKKNKWDDCLILNNKGNIAESTIANLFWIKNKTIYTPTLSEGCVAGVLRSYLLGKVPAIIESPCSIQNLKEADEIFLTNAIRGIRWVQFLEEKEYGNPMSEAIYKEYISPLLV